jgi:hypothetical protein
MPEPQEDTQSVGGVRRQFRRYLRREPVILALLSALAVAFFLAVTALSRIYEAQQESLGNRWFMRGAADFGLRCFTPVTATLISSIWRKRWLV